MFIENCVILHIIIKSNKYLLNSYSMMIFLKYFDNVDIIINVIRINLKNSITIQIHLDWI